MQQSNQKGHWEITKPGHYEYVYRKPCNTPYGQQGWREGWYEVWISPKRRWVGPKPKVYIMGWRAVWVSLTLLLFPGLLINGLVPSYANFGLLVIMAGLILLAAGFVMIMDHYSS